MSESFGSYLKNLRVECELSQKEVAEHLGVSSMAISQYEGGRAYPPKKYLNKLASLYNVRVNELKFRMFQEEFEIQDNIDFLELEEMLQRQLANIPNRKQPTLRFVDPAYQELNSLIKKSIGKSFEKTFPKMCSEDKEKFVYGITIAWAAINGPVELEMF